MRDFTTFRSSAIRYWEKRRIVYNLVLIMPAVFGYLTATELPTAVGDRSFIGVFGLGALFIIAALGANICYSFCYALEFLFGTDDAGATWLRLGRRVTLIAGVIVAIILAILGGRNVGLLEYQFRRVAVNDAAALDGGRPLRFASMAHCPGASEPRR